MDEAGNVVVRIGDYVEGDDEQLALLTRRLRAALLELDVQDVEVATGKAPDAAKGVGAVLGWLLVTVGGESVKVVVDRVADWAASNGRSIEITIDGKTLKLSKVSREEQRELIETFKAQLP